MKISLIHPSRGRAEKSCNNSKEWIQKAGVDVELIISTDESDESRDYYFHRYSNEWLLNPNGNTWKSFIITNNNTCVVEATNHAAKSATGDILVYLSDDFKCPDNWGQLILEQFQGVTTPMLLKVDDCLQNFGVGVLTIPIMNRALYEKLKYFWHPGYKSMWVDVDLYETCKRLNVIKYAPNLKFPHEHHSMGKSENDETYKRSAANWDQGQQLFNQRKKLNFPLDGI